MFSNVSITTTNHFDPATYEPTPNFTLAAFGLEFGDTIAEYEDPETSENTVPYWMSRAWDEIKRDIATYASMFHKARECFVVVPHGRYVPEARAALDNAGVLRAVDIRVSPFPTPKN